MEVMAVLDTAYGASPSQAWLQGAYTRSSVNYYRDYREYEHSTAQLRLNLLHGHASPPGPAPAPAPLNLVVRARSVSEDSDSSSVRSGDSREQSNAAKCREYREKNKMRRQQEEAEYHEELRKNEELKKVYDQKEQSIAKLKEYYYECLKKGTFVGQSKSKKKKPKKMKNSHVDRFKLTETSTKCDNKDSSKKTVKSESDIQANVWIKPELFDAYS